MSTLTGSMGSISSLPARLLAFLRACIFATASRLDREPSAEGLRGALGSAGGAAGPGSCLLMLPAVRQHTHTHAHTQSDSIHKTLVRHLLAPVSSATVVQGHCETSNSVYLATVKIAPKNTSEI